MNVSKQFLDDFNLIVDFYEVSEEDAARLKEIARIDYPAMRKSMFDTALRIRIMASYQRRPAIPGITLDKCVVIPTPIKTLDTKKKRR